MTGLKEILEEHGPDAAHRVVEESRAQFEDLGLTRRHPIVERVLKSVHQLARDSFRYDVKSRSLYTTGELTPLQRELLDAHDRLHRDHK